MGGERKKEASGVADHRTFRGRELCGGERRGCGVWALAGELAQAAAGGSAVAAIHVAVARQ